MIGNLLNSILALTTFPNPAFANPFFRLRLNDAPLGRFPVVRMMLNASFPLAPVSNLEDGDLTNFLKPVLTLPSAKSNHFIVYLTGKNLPHNVC